MVWDVQSRRVETRIVALKKENGDLKETIRKRDLQIKRLREYLKNAEDYSSSRYPI